MSDIKLAMRHLFFVELTGGDDNTGDLVVRLLHSAAAITPAAGEHAVREALAAVLPEPWHISHIRHVSGCDTDVHELLCWDAPVPGLMHNSGELNLPRLIEAFTAVGARGDLQEFFPGATVEEVGSVMMQDIVGEYDTPNNVPEWAWVERSASFDHRANGKEGGVWEFVLNLDRDLPDIPEKLSTVIAEARRKGLSYLVFHQGT